ncbi:MAG: GyrI-like domain-containing protein [Clostridia bacterium]|nr:GyrI-like domain-containing protein [Clostridia bacterium]
MSFERIIKPAFTVIGQEDSTADGPGFIPRLWETANARFGEVAALAKKTPDGSLAGVWGAMSDLSRSFQPWEEGFTKGLYLAGVECGDGAEAPEGWVKWVIPGFEYVKVSGEENAFPAGLGYLQAQGFTLAGAVHDFTDPATGENAMFFPIRRL